MYKMFWLLPVLLLAGCGTSKRAMVKTPGAPRSESGAEMLRVFNDFRTPPGGELQTERYLVAKERIARMGHAVSLGAWVSLGPSTIGGRTRSLLIHPTYRLCVR